jgi:DNA-directed RNA polymerase specialized sigma24 family protein
MTPEEQIEKHDWEGCRRALVAFFAHRHFRDPQEAAQETLARMMAELKAGFSPATEEDFRRYLFGIAKHVLHGYFRADGRMSTEFTPEPSVSEPMVLGLYSEEASCLVAELTGLSKQDADLVLASLATTTEDLAASLGINRALLALRLHRAKKKLRKILGEKMGPGGNQIARTDKNE